MSSSQVDLIGELEWRGLVHQVTERDALAKHLAEPPRVVYCGFDPTADSLTIGNLVPILLLRHFQRAGHRPIVLTGGATGLIGDPSGKDAERSLRTIDEVRANVAAQRKIFERLLAFDGPVSALMRDNYDWTSKIGFIDALRDIGKHFSVNQMVQRDSVRNRLESREQGISYIEFSYMLMQAYDFQYLYEHDGCTIQTAGSDQWGNIVSGIDLIRRTQGLDSEGQNRVFGLTAPLVTKADGSKFGKSEQGAVWLSADRTSPYAFHQFWLNSADEDAVRWLRVFTFLPREEIEQIEREHAAAPHQRAAQRRLADEVTTAVHGCDETERATRAAEVLFGRGDLASLDERTLSEVFAAAPSSDHSVGELESGGAPLIDVLAGTSLASSKGEARKLLTQKSISVNGHKVEDLEATLGSKDLLPGRVVVLRRGKKSWHVTRWS